MRSKYISITLIAIIAILAVNAKAAGILDDKRAVFSKIDAGGTAELDSSINALKTTYANDANGLSWALVHIAQYLDEKGNTAKANEIRQQVISQYPGTEQAEAANIRILESDIFKLLDSKNYSKADELMKQLQTDYKNNPAAPWALEDIANKLQIQGYESKAVEIRKGISISCKDADLAGIVNEQLAIIERCGSKLTLISALIDEKQYDLAHTQACLFMQTCRELKSFTWRLIGVAEKFEKAGQTDMANVIYLDVISDTSQPVESGYAAMKLYNVDKFIADGKLSQAKEAIDKIKNDYSGRILESALLFVGEEYFKVGYKEDEDGSPADAKLCYQEAISNWATLISQYPGSEFLPEIYYMEGQIYQKLGDYAMAVQVFMQAYQANPKFKFADYCLFAQGNCWERLKAAGDISAEEADEMIEIVYKTFLTQYPAHSMSDYVILRLGKLKMEQRKYAAACGYFQWFLTVADSNDPRIDDTKKIIERYRSVVDE